MKPDKKIPTSLKAAILDQAEAKKVKKKRTRRKKA